MDSNEVAELARAAKRLARRAKPLKSTPLTAAGIQEAFHVLDMAAQHSPPEAVAVFARLRTLLDRELAKQGPVRMAARQELVRWLFRTHYEPEGKGVRAAAFDMATKACSVEEGVEYRAEPMRTIANIVRTNGGKIPSEGTIKKDLEKIDLSDD